MTDTSRQQKYLQREHFHLSLHLMAAKKYVPSADKKEDRTDTAMLQLEITL